MILGYPVNTNQLPLFVTIKNFNLSLNHGVNNAALLTGGKVVSLKPTICEARDSIPMPVYPKDSLKKQKLEEHDDFEDMKIVSTEALRDDTISDNCDLVISGFHFHDNPYDEEAMDDYEILGVSFSIIWVCQDDFDATIEHLLDFAKEAAKDDERIGCSILRQVWSDYLDRLFILSEDIQKDYCDFIFNVRGEFIRRVSLQPKAPLQSDWDDLEEMLWK